MEERDKERLLEERAEYEEQIAARQAKEESTEHSRSRNMGFRPARSSDHRYRRFGSNVSDSFQLDAEVFLCDEQWASRTHGGCQGQTTRHALTTPCQGPFTWHRWR